MEKQSVATKPGPTKRRRLDADLLTLDALVDFLSLETSHARLHLNVSVDGEKRTRTTDVMDYGSRVFLVIQDVSQELPSNRVFFQNCITTELFDVLIDMIDD